MSFLLKKKKEKKIVSVFTALDPLKLCHTWYETTWKINSVTLFEFVTSGSQMMDYVDFQLSKCLICFKGCPFILVMAFELNIILAINTNLWSKFLT